MDVYIHNKLEYFPKPFFEYGSGNCISGPISDLRTAWCDQIVDC